MALRLADRLHAARQRLFVGRAAELALLQSVLTAPEFPFQLLYVFGPGGVGKTTLLNQYRLLCQTAGVPVFYIDGRNVEPSPEAFADALRASLGIDAPVAPLEVLAGSFERHVLMIDTYETLAPLDGWLQECFLPQLPEHTLVVLAGRQPPTATWRADPGWQALIHILPLRNLSPDESHAYLHKREISPSLHASLLDFTYGHPLALSLFADVIAQRPDAHFQPMDTPDVIKILLEQFVQKVPGPAHRAALEVCALVRLTSEGLLAEVLGLSDAHELFDWLRGLSFIEARAHGIFPHDLARETLVADLRWRNPDWYAELHRRLRAYYAPRLQQTHGIEQQRTLFDYIFLHRDNPVVRPFFEWQTSGNALIDTMQEQDVPELLAMVAQHEGAEAAHLAEHWFERQPHGVLVARDAQHQPLGFLTLVALHEANAEDIDVDPATRAAWRYLEHHAVLRPNEGATIFRFWMARDTYQAISPTQTLLGVSMVRHYLTTPGLAFTFFPCADPEFWAPLCSYVNLTHIPEADFVIGGRRYGVYGHDWRAVPPIAWLALLGEREIAATPQSAPPPQEAMVVLSQPAFTMAIREALQHYTRPDKLRRNPLLRSRLVMERVDAAAGIGERVSALQSLLREAADVLTSSPRQMKLYRALYHTYFNPAATQEQAAELLELPFSTYRRHLQAGVMSITELLWQRETGAQAT